MNLQQLVDPNLVFTDLVSEDSDSVLRELALRLESRGAIPSADDLYRRLLEREGQGTTAIGRGVAIPHCKLALIERVLLAVGAVPAGIAIESPDREPVRLFFLLVSPAGSPVEHLQSLAAIAKWVRNTENLERLRQARSSAEVSACLLGAGEERSARG